MVVTGLVSHRQDSERYCISAIRLTPSWIFNNVNGECLIVLAHGCGLILTCLVGYASSLVDPGGSVSRAMALPKGIKWPVWPHPNG